MGTNYLPTRESELRTWCSTFSQVVADDPAASGLGDAQSDEYAAAVSAFAAAYQLANKPATRSPGNIEIKNTKKDALLVLTRKLVKQAQASPVMTNDKRAALGITIPDVDPTPVPVPEVAPQLDVVSVAARTVKVRLRDAATGNRKKPAGVAGAAVLSYVGATVPADMRGWFFEGNTTRLDTEVEFSATVPTGSQVWLTAFWFNRRGESGPACPPMSTHVGFGVLSSGGSGEQSEAA